jgi:hypothetical protein
LATFNGVPRPINPAKPTDAGNGFLMRHRPDVANRQHPSWISNPSCQFNQRLYRKWDQRFESALLHRRV